MQIFFCAKIMKKKLTGCKEEIESHQSHLNANVKHDLFCNSYIDRIVNMITQRFGHV